MEKAKNFVDYVLREIKLNKSFAAKLRRADNPATEYQSWEILARWCDLDKDWSRLPYAIIGASLAREKFQSDGTVSIGRAVALAYSDNGKTDGSEQEAAKAKIRRLLACKTASEACGVLRPLLKLVASREIRVNHASLLNDLIWFKSEKTTPRWAMDFYRKGDQ